LDTTNTARLSVQAFSDVFWDRIISSDIWLANSPDINPCDLFLLGFFEGQNLNSNPRTEEQKENIRWKIGNIPAEQLQRVNQNLFRRCEECLHVEEQHLQHHL
jgi:hypothetical protein